MVKRKRGSQIERFCIYRLILTYLLSKAISQKRCKIGSHLVSITNRKSHTITSFRLVQKSVTLNDVMVKLRSRYGDFSIFQDGGRRHLGFSNFGNFNVGTLNMAKLSQCARFRRNRSYVKTVKIALNLS